MSDYLENQLIDHIFRARAFSAPATLYISLHTGTTTDAGGGTEVTGGAYARVAVTSGFAKWFGTGGETTDVDSAGTGGLTDNRDIETFPAPSGGNWGLITHIAVWDAATTGNMLFHGALGTPKTVNDGDPAPKINAGDLDITLA